VQTKYKVLARLEHVVETDSLISRETVIGDEFDDINEQLQDDPSKNERHAEQDECEKMNEQPSK
jgi:hypothetical protein